MAFRYYGLVAVIDEESVNSAHRIEADGARSDSRPKRALYSQTGASWSHFRPLLDRLGIT
jgi:hypothetical protein